MSNNHQNKQNKITIYANDSIVTHLSNYLETTNNPSDDLIPLTQKDDESSTSTSTSASTPRQSP
jgi:hypothetical protein